MLSTSAHHAHRKHSTRRETTMDSQALRKKNLRAVIRQWEGPTNLAKKLKYRGPSFLSQMVGAKPITEKTARHIEKSLDLPDGWMDADHDAQPSPARVDTSIVNRVMFSVSAALEEAGLAPTPARMAELVGLAYEYAVEHGEIDDAYVIRLVSLIKE